MFTQFAVLVHLSRTEYNFNVYLVERIFFLENFQNNLHKIKTVPISFGLHNEVIAGMPWTWTCYGKCLLKVSGVTLFMNSNDNLDCLEYPLARRDL